MTISNTTEDAILNLVFRAVSWTDYATSTGETNISNALHTADPTDSGTMSSSEAAYSGYARTNVTRGAGYNASSGGSISPASNIDFPVSTAGTGSTITFFSTGHTGASTQPILWFGGVSPSIVTGTGGGVTPRLTAATVHTLD